MYDYHATHMRQSRFYHPPPTKSNQLGIGRLSYQTPLGHGEGKIASSVILHDGVLQQPLGSDTVKASMPLTRATMRTVFVRSNRSSQILQINCETPFKTCVYDNYTKGAYAFPLSLREAAIPSSKAECNTHRSRGIVIPHLTQNQARSPPVPHTIRAHASTFKETTY